MPMILSCISGDFEYPSVPQPVLVFVVASKRPHLNILNI
ncbi:hypothetical protein YPPY66_4214 [Yersinia pestis PY-66]|nr:hypothetical protein YPPY02_3887 [Yersinia pestis PY-02]EIR56959.1 hypothetical protein YPPY19_3880 [Yersinia pestis PY-19]EIR86867.1 hypothetical protein YPPY42_3932 [Yersinia pestis PY-42]EIS41190.1 hypothetical protein YPPY59_3949 [Yersinia pestis PY-59]EIS55591.1 hypothetical protein YPPY64_4021 [Yersinia pestis PY-64]EIS68231.1 hypothetical protein YPPY66_4214 [Yersinia pestis PY-66]EIS84468.1 hypothetical protein YPPY76_3710 [Yersinia pestis PY-76]